MLLRFLFSISVYKDRSKIKPRQRCLKRTMIMFTYMYIICTDQLMNSWKILFSLNNLKSIIIYFLFLSYMIVCENNFLKKKYDVCNENPCWPPYI